MNAGMVSEAGRKSPRLLLCGLDSLYIAYFLDPSGSGLDFDDLAYRKEQLHHGQGSDFDEIRLGGESFALLPYGGKPYSYTLKNPAFLIRLGENIRPSCHVQFLSQALWQDGPEFCKSRFLAWCRALRLVATRPETVSRADWAFDFHLEGIDFDSEQFVTSAAKKQVFTEHDRAQTFQIGTSDVVVRVYDKVAEIEQASEKGWFFDLWGQDRCVWRVEFQIRGERLKRAGIRTLEDLNLLGPDLLREIATHHTRLCKPSSDSNRSRWPLHPLWQALLEAIAAMPQTGLIADIQPEKAIDWRLWNQSKSVYGYLKGMTALVMERDSLDQPPDLDAALGPIIDLIGQHHHPVEWDADVSKRHAALRLGQW
ncbi:MAG: hypothetical protein HZC25_08365 [Rhodospirillales bacterium]|nr:hypothetical protein [Rhodospirillales bacterium]